MKKSYPTYSMLHLLSLTEEDLERLENWRALSFRPFAEARRSSRREQEIEHENFSGVPRAELT